MKFGQRTKTNWNKFLHFWTNALDKPHDRLMIFCILWFWRHTWVKHIRNNHWLGMVTNFALIWSERLCNGETVTAVICPALATPTSNLYGRLPSIPELSIWVFVPMTSKSTSSISSFLGYLHSKSIEWSTKLKLTKFSKFESLVCALR